MRVEMSTSCGALVGRTSGLVHVEAVLVCVAESAQVDAYLRLTAQQLRTSTVTSSDTQGRSQEFADRGTRDGVWGWKSPSGVQGQNPNGGRGAGDTC